jgi:sugar lactone lactonase YvrE
MNDLMLMTDGLGIPESTRWRDGRVWLCNWGAGEVLAVTPRGEREVITRLAPQTLPFSIEWLPDGRLLAVDGPRRLLLRLEPDGMLFPVAELAALGEGPANELVVDGAGNAFVSDGQGAIARVTPDGSVRKVADGLTFPNGMALLDRERTLVVADSHAQALIAYDVRSDGTLSIGRVWAELEHPPDGSAPTPTARSGSPPSPASGASAYAKAARCSKPSPPIEVASHACSAAKTGAPCSSPRRNGAGWTP